MVFNFFMIYEYLFYCIFFNLQSNRSYSYSINFNQSDGMKAIIIDTISLGEESVHFQQVCDISKGNYLFVACVSDLYSNMSFKFLF
ncbi:hypothetical protein HZS_41, partial [Henneguya salminicola]